MKVCKVDGCGNKSVGHGLCPKHLYRLKKYGDPNKVSTIYGDPKARIKSKVVVDENGCWRWQKAIQPNGYGATTHKDKRISAHRLSYIAFKGDIPEGMCVCHVCDVRDCVNPDHLFLGTNSDNMQDMINKGRHPESWNKGKTRQDSKKVDGAIKKATRVRRKNYLAKCKSVYEYKNDTGATYKQMQEVFSLCDRQLVDRYKTFERHLGEMECDEQRQKEMQRASRGVGAVRRFLSPCNPFQ